MFQDEFQEPPSYTSTCWLLAMPIASAALNLHLGSGFFFFCFGGGGEAAFGGVVGGGGDGCGGEGEGSLLGDAMPINRNIMLLKIDSTAK